MTTAPQPNKFVNISLWVAQISLAAMFLMAGIMKSITPIEELGKNMLWVQEMPGLIRFIGVSEVLGALGLILPSLLKIQPKLTAAAAVGIGVIMVLAIIFHGMQNEFASVVVCLVIAAIAAFIAWGRIVKAPILAK
jgi:putative oxidoreductase